MCGIRRTPTPACDPSKAEFAAWLTAAKNGEFDHLV
jgi:hypothetical protein